ncbi:hypothetical protein ACFWUQ_20015 [Streptomyces sp. NPDC058662]|uniref:hypothetical protein n=1 Tax=Streptomyces sp. NPDC058662 TaxID=3346583 RepID=UPI0036501AD3
MQLRFVLVPGLTDGRGNVEGVAAVAGSLGNVSRVDVLPFRALGVSKWESLDMPYTLRGTPPRTAGQVAAAKAVFAARGLKAV